MYLVQDDSPYACCTLLTAINARRFLDGQPMAEHDTPEFEALVDLTGCRYGSCTCIRYAWRLFELHTQYGPHDPEWIMRRLSEGRPVGLSAFVPDWGNHSVLCVGATHEAAYVVNWKKGSPITEVPWGSIDTPPYARQEATAFALRGGWDGGGELKHLANAAR